MTVSSDGTTNAATNSNTDFLPATGEGTLVHVGVSYKAGVVKFYKNGAFFSEGTNAQTTLFNNVLQDAYIGRYVTAYLTGKMWQPAIFNKELSAADFKKIYDGGKDAKCPVKRGLVAEYSGRDYEGPAATPTKIFDVASWDGLNVLT